MPMHRPPPPNNDCTADQVKVGEGQAEPTDYPDATASIIVIYREGWTRRKEGRKERGGVACHKSHPRPLSPRKPLLSLCIFPSSRLHCTFHLFRQLRFPSTQSRHTRLSLLRFTSVQAAILSA